MAPTLAPDRLPRRPRLARGWTRLPGHDGRLQLRLGDARVAVVEGSLPSEALLDLLDGRLTLEELLAAHPGGADAGEVRAALEALAAQGLLEDAGHGSGTSWLAAAGADPGAAQERLSRAAVAVVGEGSLAREVRAVLAAEGVGQGAPEGADLLVYVEEAYAPEPLLALNERCLREGRPWLHVSAAPGLHAAVGPLFVPPDTCCYACLTERRAANAEAQEEHQELRRFLAGGGHTEPVGLLAAHRALLAGAATLAAVQHLVGLDGALLYDRWRLFDLRTLETWTEPVLRVPDCPACGRARAGRPPWAP